jgi:acyl-CoA synthetase (AMP-forming)/AMP-acid ligase II
VVVAARDPLACLVALFATWVSGNCAVLVNPELKPDERVRVTAKVTPRLWFGASGLRPVAGDAPPPEWPDAALILMTSGTTGEPKGVTHSLAGLEARLRLNLAAIGETALARALCPLPLYFGHGLIGNCLTPLLAGGTVHILDRPGMEDFAGMGALIDRLNVTFLSSVPSFWRMVLRMSPPPAAPPGRVHVGSAPLPVALWSEIAEWCGTDEVYNTYGMTETANWISGARLDAAGAEGNVGKPWGGRFGVFRDGALRETGRGEVAVQSPARMLGLWGAAEQAETPDGWLMTGDIGELQEDQTLRLIGRVKNEINKGGIKVLAEEVDMLLERHPDVLEACAFGIPDEISGELVGAVVRIDGQTTPEELIAWCRGEVRADAVPHRVAVADEIAKTDRGKPDRRAERAKWVAAWS